MFRLFRPHNAPEFVPEFAVKNIHGMRRLRKSLGLGYKKVVRGSGCAKSNIISYEMYAVLPQKRTTTNWQYFLDGGCGNDRAETVPVLRWKSADVHISVR